MNIYFNMNWVLQTMDSLKDNKVDSIVELKEEDDKLQELPKDRKKVKDDKLQELPKGKKKIKDNAESDYNKEEKEEEIVFRKCEHPGFCKSPAVIQKGSKWFCISHAV